MYSMQPLPDHSDVHVGFYIVCGICLLVFSVIMSLWKEDEIETHSLAVWSAILLILGYMAHENSYTPHHPLNQQVIGEFVRFESEGFRERSGKSTVDRHYTYVVYRVGNSEVLFAANTGVAYPPRAILYKN